MSFDFLSPAAPMAPTEGPMTSIDASDAGVPHVQKAQGKAAEYISSKGFGWMLEVDAGEDDDANTPLLEELDIDVKDIFYKLRCIIFPWPALGFQLDRSVVRDNPDFWGPLLVVLLYALVSLYGQFRVVSWIMCIWFGGSSLVFLLCRVLGSDQIGFSQSLGVIGYSLLPLVLLAPVLSVTSTMTLLSMLIKALAVVWATYSASSLLLSDDLSSKRYLVMYPIFLLYIYFLSLYTGA